MEFYLLKEDQKIQIMKNLKVDQKILKKVKLIEKKIQDLFIELVEVLILKILKMILSMMEKVIEVLMDFSQLLLLL